MTPHRHPPLARGREHGIRGTEVEVVRRRMNHFELQSVLGRQRIELLRQYVTVRLI
jgi:hypothetical protein